MTKKMYVVSIEVYEDQLMAVEAAYKSALAKRAELQERRPHLSGFYKPISKSEMLAGYLKDFCETNGIEWPEHDSEDV